MRRGLTGRTFWIWGLVLFPLSACGWDGSEAAASDAANRYAAALSSGSSTTLAGITCTSPTPDQARAFERRAAGGRLAWAVHSAPEVDGDRADGVLRARDENAHRDYEFTLLKRGDGWCAHYDWASLTR